MKEDIILKFASYMADNKVTTEELIEDFYQKNKTDENEEILRREAIFNKALITFYNGNYQRSNLFYKQLFKENLLDNEDQKSMVKLFICQNYIKLGNKKEASELVNNYFEKNNNHYDLDFLICYATITKNTGIKEPYVSILNKEFSKLGYKDTFPKSYQELITAHNLYHKESVEVRDIISQENNEKKKKTIETFVKKSKFESLISWLMNS